MNIFIKILVRPLIYKQIRKTAVYKQSYFSLFLYNISHKMHWQSLLDLIQIHWRKGIIKYLKRYLKADRKKSFDSLNRTDLSNVIWTCWFQGEEEAPELIRICLRSIKRNAGFHKVVVLTERTVSQYVEFPNYILQKVNSGIITRTHYSDILRLALLNKYGGLWLDATILVSSRIPEYIFQDSFWSIRDEEYKYGNYGSLYRWTAFCMSSKPNDVLIRRSLQVLYDYWAHENGFVHYFIIDYVMALVCENDTKANDEVCHIRPSNYHLHALQLNANKAYSAELYNLIFSDTCFHKLSYKIEMSDDPQSLFNRVIGEAIEKDAQR